MRGRRITLALPLVLLLAGCRNVGESGVAAVVNGYKITYAELDRYYRDQTRDQAQPPNADQERMFRLNVLRQLIDRRILLQKAEKMGLSAIDDEVQGRLREYRAPYESDEEFERSLAEREMTVGELRQELRRTITIDKLFNKQITSRVKVAEPELREYYERNQAAFTHAEQQLHIAQILITPYPESPPPNLLKDDAVDEEQAKAKARMIEERLAGGEDFAELAENYSEDPESTANGGDLGFIPQSLLESADLASRRAMAALSPGDVSPPVEIEGGTYRIIKLISREPAGRREFSDPRVQQEIRQTLINRKDQLLKAAFLDLARSESEIENRFARRLIAEYGIAD